jgi:hypothetical protein
METHVRFRVELGADQQHETGQIKPEQHDDDAADSAVHLVELAEVDHVEPKSE